MQEPFEHSLRVRYGECDPQGIVFNANYLLYFDVAFTELWRVALGSFDDLHEVGIDVVVANANIDFRAPARYDDVLALRARVARLGTTSLTTEYDVMRDGQLLVSGQLRHVCVARRDLRKTAIPGWVSAGLRPFARGDVEQALDGPSEPR